MKNLIRKILKEEYRKSIINEQNENEFNKQLEWWKDYINSPMYIERLKKDGSTEGGKDGMDASLICFDFNNNKLSIIFIRV